ncbi:MAG TPA: hypothetical protein PK147_07205 [Saprospiraceae bacterium]|nr:hypothetical protein [Saprospiraceae bacterium]HPQ21622.1 hypothetical protein [Saprospiraceae bacterium]
MLNIATLQNVRYINITNLDFITSALSIEMEILPIQRETFAIPVLANRLVHAARELELPITRYQTKDQMVIHKIVKVRKAILYVPPFLKIYLWE